MQESPTLLATARAAASAAGRMLREKWLEPRELTQKGFRDWVTDADFAAQKAITDLIQARHPDHGFLTEEDNPELPTTGPAVWIIDPVDGTSNYSRQQPNFCVSIAAAVDGHLQAGVVYDPLRDEMFSATPGRGATRNGHPIHVSPVDNLAQAIIALDWSHRPDDRQAILDTQNALAHHVRTMRAIGSAALALAWVAAGRCDAYFNRHLQPWDVAAGALLIEEASGTITGWQGQPWTYRPDAVAAITSNGHIHQQLLEQVARGA